MKKINRILQDPQKNVYIKRGEKTSQLSGVYVCVTKNSITGWLYKILERHPVNVFIPFGVLSSFSKKKYKVFFLYLKKSTNKSRNSEFLAIL